MFLEKLRPERNQLLKSYFEPTDEECERGFKLPTGAHKANAGLVASGYIKVILTTNFDHLLESALLHAGLARCLAWNRGETRSFGLYVPKVVSTTSEPTGTRCLGW